MELALIELIMMVSVPLPDLGPVCDIVEISAKF